MERGGCVGSSRLRCAGAGASTLLVLGRVSSVSAGRRWSFRFLRVVRRRSPQRPLPSPRRGFGPRALPAYPWVEGHCSRSISARPASATAMGHEAGAIAAGQDDQTHEFGTQPRPPTIPAAAVTSKSCVRRRRVLGCGRDPRVTGAPKPACASASSAAGRRAPRARARPPGDVGRRLGCGRSPSPSARRARRRGRRARGRPPRRGGRSSPLRRPTSSWGSRASAIGPRPQHLGLVLDVCLGALL